MEADKWLAAPADECRVPAYLSLARTTANALRRPIGFQSACRHTLYMKRCFLSRCLTQLWDDDQTIVCLRVRVRVRPKWWRLLSRLPQQVVAHLRARLVAWRRGPRDHSGRRAQQVGARNNSFESKLLCPHFKLVAQLVLKSAAAARTAAPALLSRFVRLRNDN